MKSSLCLALVHNNNEVRNNSIRPCINSLLHEVQHICDVEKIEVSFQDSVVPHGFLMAFSRDLIYFKLSYQWRRYCLLNPFRLLDLIRFLKRSFLKYIFSTHTIGKRWKKNSAIEVAVTDKHIRVWAKFLDTNADWLICFEDDAVFKQDSISNVEALLGQLVNMSCHNPLYIDLAGGCDLKDLGIEKLLVKQDECFRYYKKPVTNTACAYLMNRSLVSKFHSILTRKPWIRLIAVDLMMNNLFIHMNDMVLKPEERVICMHADPTFFKHGTTTGDYVSWQADV